MRVPRAGRLIGLLLALSPALAAAANAPAIGPVARIAGPIEPSRRVELPGNVARALSASTDLGAADPALPVERVVMVLGASAAQEAELAQFLRNVQTRGRPEYHRWLTPAAFGQRYGVAASDLSTIRSWLQSRGFRLEAQAAGRRSIVFSGTVGELNDTFGTRMHQYRWHGERHLANSMNPSIPQALSGVVRGFASLHDFRLRPQHVRSRLRPQTDLVGGAHALGPGDFAVIYDLAATYARGVTGSGSAIAVIGRSDVQSVDLNNFRSTFGLPASLPAVVLAGSDPGLVATDQTESDLDLEWAGGIAPAAALKFVTAASTGQTDGVVLSAQFAVEQNLADVISVSYGTCETSTDISGGTTFFNQLWQQAAAQGTSVFISSGDSGAAGCDPPASTTAGGGAAVNQLCSSPYSTCVGGTEFTADIASPASYWSPGNTPGTLVSALKYIGEAVWNDSGTVSGGSGLWASGGGTSLYFAKPAWQLSTGVPGDGRRDVPDVALNAAANHDPYLIYSSDGNSSSTLEAIGGTSASTPSLAGIAALVIQQQGGRVGSFNPILYGLSSRQAAGGSTVFHTITSGNNSVPGQVGFSASSADPVYNQATGLGSLDAGLLVTRWGSFVASGAGLTPLDVVLPAAASIGSAVLTLPSATPWSATVGGGGTGWLAVTPTSGTGSTPLTYSASANTSGAARSGTITIDGQVLAVTQAAASGAAQLSVSSAALSFGADELGTNSAGQLLLVSNSGGSALTLGAISISGAARGDYADSGSCAAGLMLAPGASCFLNLSFDPSALGNRAATLQIGSASVALSGTGTPITGGDGPLPPWSYAMLGAALLAIAVSRQRLAVRGRRS
jgi:subtilase family serine protease